MYCSNCGHELENEAKFCSNCGNKIDGDFESFAENKNMGACNHVDEEKSVTFCIGDKRLEYSSNIISFNDYFSRSYAVRGKYVKDLRDYYSENCGSFELIYYGMSEIALDYAEKSLDYAIGIIEQYQCKVVHNEIKDKILRTITKYKDIYHSTFLTIGEIALKNHTEEEFLKDNKNIRCLIDFVKYVWKDVNSLLDDILKKTRGFRWEYFYTPIEEELYQFSLDDAIDDATVWDMIFEVLQANPYSIVAYRFLYHACWMEIEDEVNELMSYFGVKDIIENLNLSIIEDIMFEDELEELIKQYEESGEETFDGYVKKDEVREIKIRLLDLFVDVDKILQEKENEEKRRIEEEKRRQDEEKLVTYHCILRKANEGTVSALSEAIRELENLRGYKDCDQLLEKYKKEKIELEEKTNNEKRDTVLSLMSDDGKDKFAKEKSLCEIYEDISGVINKIDYQIENELSRSKLHFKEIQVTVYEIAKVKKIFGYVGMVLFVLITCVAALGMFAGDIFIGLGIFVIAVIVYAVMKGMDILFAKLTGISKQKKIKAYCDEKLPVLLDRLEENLSLVKRLWTSDEMVYYSNFIPELFQNKEGVKFLEGELRKNEFISELQLFEWCTKRRKENKVPRLTYDSTLNSFSSVRVEIKKYQDLVSQGNLEELIQMSGMDNYEEEFLDTDKLGKIFLVIVCIVGVLIILGL